MSNILEIVDYSLEFEVPNGTLRVLDSINLTVKRGEVVGLVGESGSGKTTLSWSIMRHMAENAREVSGEIRLEGEDLTKASMLRMETLRGGKLGMIFQDPSASLNPTMTLGEQVVEVLMRHRGLDQKAAWLLGVQLLTDVELKQPAEMMKRYPHEVSGGEKQRVLIATAFACEPDCLIFDEPTTALDVISSAQILALFDKLREQTQVAALYISHDLALVSQVADRVCVLNKGRIVEQAPARDIFANPQDPYTQKLVSAVPNPNQRLLDEPSKRFSDLLSVSDLSVYYGGPSFVDRLLRRPKAPMCAANKLNIQVGEGEIVGVIGESGSGKSTLAKALSGLVAYQGNIDYCGSEIKSAADMDKDYRRRVQIIFQHPDASLNPRHKIRDILARPLRLYNGCQKGETEAQAIARLLVEVDLPAEFADRYPHELSGGQKQRVAIARAFAAKPQLVICDEITAALDVSVQATVVKLLLDLRRRHGTAYLFITHDLNLIRQIAHKLVIMYRGDLVETTDVETLAKQGGQHPYTQALMEAIPKPANTLQGKVI
ncbi:peptide/nickel transport system ATP-binding protein [Vibrio xiamenensis]|uniref:Peptide/nickel transport system ATP-binding protein n=1 Tax=Vibrio xiamenensis TaxID=861298 RepID=A0A1G8FZF4_9VIBR|nr:ABC transporter ATP-binding protein [Vibrio xiamenensis]SDH87511.1 peptide/nickel transport system ATP-binding protein [Vibrio xiamenensis]